SGPPRRYAAPPRRWCSTSSAARSSRSPRIIRLARSRDRATAGGDMRRSAVNLGRVDLLGNRGYVVTADFPTVGGLKAGSTIEIAGVEVGRVDRIELKDYQAHVVMVIHPGIQLQEDSIASIKTKGLIGERYVRLSPGGSDKIIPPNGRI